MNASVYLGEYDAENEVEAIKLAEENNGANWMPSLCAECATEVELNDIYDVQVVPDE
jgi:hypothetical protein